MTTLRNNPDSTTPRRGHQSIFFKLFTVLLGTIFLTYLACGGFYRSSWNASTRADAHPSLIHYWTLLSDEIGNPPDTLRAARLSKELGVAVGITGPSINWHSDDFSEYIQNQTSLSSSSNSLHMLLHEGRIWAAIPRNGYTFVYGSRRRPPVEGLSSDWIALLLVVALAWLLAWFTLHRMLRPLRGLEMGVKAVAQGDLEIRLPEKGNDELAGLARSFNIMTGNLKERLLARDQLLLDVSHELRSPLTRMRVALEMAPPGMAVNSLHEEVEALEKMVAEILENERLNSPAGRLRRESVNLSELVSETVSTMEAHWPGVTWNGSDFPSLPGDAERLRRVLRNLLENALKYGKNAPKPVEISLRREGDSAVLEVLDFGPGIPEEEQRLVFEPFYRVDRSRSRSPGYGLGLPLCKRIVEAHGGSISLRSRPGEGTRVTIKLPLR